LSETFVIFIIINKAQFNRDMFTHKLEMARDLKFKIRRSFQGHR